jgi:threonine dehydrogenase-like Zn-dependent dehydrogenase
VKAVVFHGVGDIRLDDVEEPKIQESTDAIVRLISSAICGTDLHMIRGTLAGMLPGTILGHEGVGVVEEVGPQTRNLNVGDRVVVGSTIGCGYCMYCRDGFYAQCDNANPNGPQAETARPGVRIAQWNPVRSSYDPPLQDSTRLQVLLPSLSLLMGWISLKPWLLS